MSFKTKKIANEISNIFNKFKKSGPFTIKHPADKTGKSNVKQIQFNLSETGDGVLIECYDFQKQYLIQIVFHYQCIQKS